jgi:hypothetical protein
MLDLDKQQLYKESGNCYNLVVDPGAGGVSGGSSEAEQKCNAVLWTLCHLLECDSRSQ